MCDWRARLSCGWACIAWCAGGPGVAAQRWGPHAGSQGPAAPAPLAAGPLDVRSAMAAAAQQGGDALLLTLPWVVAYLTFLPWDGAAAGSQYFGCAPHL